MVYVSIEIHTSAQCLQLSVVIVTMPREGHRGRNWYCRKTMPTIAFRTFRRTFAASAWGERVGVEGGGVDGGKLV